MPGKCCIAIFTVLISLVLWKYLLMLDYHLHDLLSHFLLLCLSLFFAFYFFFYKWQNMCISKIFLNQNVYRIYPKRCSFPFSKIVVLKFQLMHEKGFFDTNFKEVLYCQTQNIIAMFKRDDVMSQFYGFYNLCFQNF